MTTKDALPESGSEKKLSREEIEYRKKLRDAIVSVTNAFLHEHREEIIKRAEALLKFEEELLK